MTVEEFDKYISMLCMHMYDLSGADCTNNQTGNTVTISERECVAFACGLNAAQVIRDMTPGKPVDAMTDEDIERDSQAVIKALAELFEQLETDGAE